MGITADQNINKFDLVIDWGMVLFLQNPYFVIDYLFKFQEILALLLYY